MPLIETSDMSICAKRIRSRFHEHPARLRDFRLGVDRAQLYYVCGLAVVIVIAKHFSRYPLQWTTAKRDKMAAPLPALEIGYAGGLRLYEPHLRFGKLERIR